LTYDYDADLANVIHLYGWRDDENMLSIRRDRGGAYMISVSMYSMGMSLSVAARLGVRIQSISTTHLQMTQSHVDTET